MKQALGFTLIELLLVIGVIAILAGAVLVALNPARQFAQARNTQRRSNVSTLLNAINQRISDNKGVFEEGCAAGAIPTSTKAIATTTYNIGPCLVPAYLSMLPVDPSAVGAYYSSITNYNTGYTVVKDANGRITVSAPSAELGEGVSITH